MFVATQYFTQTFYRVVTGVWLSPCTPRIFSSQAKRGICCYVSGRPERYTRVIVKIVTVVPTGGPLSRGGRKKLNSRQVIATGINFPFLEKISYALELLPCLESNT